MFRILVLLLSNHWFSQYYAKWFKRKHNGLKITANGLRLAKPTSEASVITLLSIYYICHDHQNQALCAALELGFGTELSGLIPSNGCIFRPIY
jgi:hypothetical protein